MKMKISSSLTYRKKQDEKLQPLIFMTKEHFINKTLQFFRAYSFTLLINSYNVNIIIAFKRINYSKVVLISKYAYY